MVKEERERKRQMREQDEIKQDQQKKRQKLVTFDAFIKFLREKGLKENRVVLGPTRYNQFNGRQYAEIIERDYVKGSDVLKGYYESDKSETDESKKRVNLTNFLIEEHIIVKVEDNPQQSKLKTTNDKYVACKEQKVNSDKDILEGYFVFNPYINIQPKSNYVYMTLILLGIALVILFPVWPITLKKLLFYISVVLLFLLVGLIVVRTFFYFLVRVFGFDFYIFPNLFADVGFFDSFKPIIGYEKCNDSKLAILLRFVGMIIMGYFIYLLSVERYAVKQFGQQTFDDIVDWGYQKLEYVQAPPAKSIEQIIQEQDNEYLNGTPIEENNDDDQF